MKNLTRTLLAMLMALMLFMSVASAEADSNFNTTGYPICDEPITITLSGNWGNTPDWNDTVFVQEIEKRLGIKIDCQPIPEDAWDNQFTLMLASNSLPDMLTRLAGISAMDISDYGAQGFFLPLNDYIDEYAPNLKAWMGKYPLLEKYMTSADGNMYMLVSCTDNDIALTPRVYMNKIWLENLGLEAPKTIDELYEVLKAFKEQDANGNGDPNDEIPLNFLIDGDAGYFLEGQLLAAFDIYSWHWGEMEYFIQAKDGEVYLADTTENYKAYLKFMNKLYEEELLDNECYIQTYDEFLSKGERIGYTGYWAPFVLASKDGSYDLDFIWSGAYTSEWNDTPTIVRASPVGSSPLGVVSAQTENPEAIVRLIDYLYTDEGRQAAIGGYEGITFDYVDVDVAGTDYKIRSAVGYAPEGYDTSEEYRYTKVVINGAFTSLTSKGYEGLAELPVEFLYNQEVVDAYGGWAVALAYYGLRNEANTVVNAFPSLIYSEEESAARAKLYTDIQLYLKNSKAQFITGEVDIDQGWDNYVSTLEKMGLDEILAIEQAAYSRLMGE